MTHTDTVSVTPDVLHIAFDRSLTVGDATEVLRSNGARIIEGPDSTGIIGVTANMTDAKHPGREMHLLAERLRADVATAALGGNEKARDRHTSRGKLLPRDRVERLLDPGAPFLEIGQLAANDLYEGDVPGAGMIAGDILKILTPGDDVYDPNTGAFLGRSPGQLKGTVEVVDFIGTDAAVGNVHTGGNFQEGDMVQLY